MRLFLLLFILGLTSSRCFASGNFLGNGAIGISYQGHLFLLDFLEPSSQKMIKPSLKKTYENGLVRAKLARFNLPPGLSLDKNILEQKISLLWNYSPEAGYLVLASLLSLHWISQDYVPFADQDTLSEYQQWPTFALAYRSERNVFISRVYWNEISDFDRAALLIHEALYAADLAHPSSSLDRVSRSLPYMTRAVVRLLFSLPEFPQNPGITLAPDDLWTLLAESGEIDHLPSPSIQFNVNPARGNNQEISIPILSSISPSGLCQSILKNGELYDTTLSFKMAPLFFHLSSPEQELGSMKRIKIFQSSSIFSFNRKIQKLDIRKCELFLIEALDFSFAPDQP